MNNAAGERSEPAASEARAVGFNSSLARRMIGVRVQGTGEPKPVAIQVTDGEIAQAVISIAQRLLDSKTEGLHAFPHNVHIWDDYTNVGPRPTLRRRKVLLLVEKQAPIIEAQSSESAVAALQCKSQRGVERKRTFEIEDG